MVVQSPNATIQVLPKKVVDQIAAGEVVQRASSAIKELMENALDAGATEITVSVNSPTEFSVMDNGCGIPVDDLALACTRHATSKLRDVTDLKSIQSFGFRGEALASISMVADVQIGTKTPNSPVGFVQHYRDGEPVNQSPTPKARPGVGTTIKVSNLFKRTMAHRKKAMTMSTEYSFIFKVVQSYALHYPKVVFTCTKAGQPMDLCTRGASDSQSVASLIFGRLSTFIEHSSQLLHHDKDSQEVKIYSADLWMADLAGGARKPKQPFLLFVNHRLVTNRTIQKELENVLESKSYLVHLDLQVPSCAVDVNVHPTKQSVVLFHLDEIARHLADSLREHLQGEMMIQPSTMSATAKKRKDQPTPDADGSDDDETTVIPEKKKPQILSQAHKVRINTSTGAMKSFLAPKTVHDPSCPAFDLSQPGAFVCKCQDIRPPAALGVRKYTPIPPTPCSYSSIKRLRKEVQDCNPKHPLKHAAFVGRFSNEKSLLQEGPNLILWSHEASAVDLFYQLALWRFKGGATVSDVGSVDVSQCVAHALQLEEELLEDVGIISPSNLSIAKEASACLVEKSKMLLEYFSIRIDKTGCLTGLPVLLDNHCASPAFLPLFLFRLATEVDYGDELKCFRGICRELGRFYAKSLPMPESFHAIRSLLYAREDMEWEVLTDLKECYRVFER